MGVVSMFINVLCTAQTSTLPSAEYYKDDTFLGNAKFVGGSHTSGNYRLKPAREIIISITQPSRLCKCYTDTKYDCRTVKLKKKQSAFRESKGYYVSSRVHTLLTGVY
jgi:hypothetical protein